jgi:curved DNA-binding protein CbpA
MPFFDDCKTQEELKERYRDLAKKYHPDTGGNA